MQAISPHHRAIVRYYEELEQYRQHGVTHEMATRSAFQNLLSALAQDAGWILIPEQALDNGKRPDGTLRDAFFTRGYWEAKDTHDDLAAEVHKKIATGYPTLNTIFEDTQSAILYQNDQRTLTADLRQSHELAHLLTLFFGYTKPEYATFERAVEEFASRIPQLARQLEQIIHREHERNPDFQNVFTGFWYACSEAVDAKITPSDIYKMLAQHLLTERIIRTVFNNPDFAKRNAIAKEIEEVIGVLTNSSFDRSQFLQPLDGFYVAVEHAAQAMSWSQKQHFLNTVYERFFQDFLDKQADTHGIVYTPQEIVDFMRASVEHVLATEFDLSLSHPQVKVLDPATGTGSFVVNILQHLPYDTVEQQYHGSLFANEVLLLPYYIASLNIEHAYYERMQKYNTFSGICFADTLKMEGAQMSFDAVSEENNSRVQTERAAPIMVVIGNPPYNVGQVSENDNNKNQRYEEVERRVRLTYAKDSKASNKNALSDVYVKFFRWATDRLRGADGVVCFVTNNSFVDQISFDGMRQHLLQDFTRIYHLDLHGNVRKNPKLSGTTHNVFGIQVGVGITIAIRSSQHTERTVYYHRVAEDWRKNQKLAFLAEKGSIAGVDWQELQPNAQQTWLTEGMQPEFSSFLPLGTREAKAITATTIDVPAIFRSYGRGVATSRDVWAYDFDKDRLSAKVLRHIETYNREVDRWRQRGASTVSVDDFVTYDDKLMKWAATSNWTSNDMLPLSLVWVSCDVPFTGHFVVSGYSSTASSTKKSTSSPSSSRLLGLRQRIG